MHQTNVYFYKLNVYHPEVFEV